MEEQTHDGKLDTNNEYMAYYGQVCIGQDDRFQWTYIEGVIVSGQDDRVSFTPKQALSFLSWLEQERAKLERMAEGE